MRIFLAKVFVQFARKERITDTVLRDAVQRAEAGLIDADLGGGVIKQRIARPGGGKSGGYRAIILFRRGSRTVFIYGFSKSQQDNIDQGELREFREAAREILGFSEADMDLAVKSNAFKEIMRDA